ncbi:MAG TPA: shikimate kinase [Fimbriimonadaceae bacterium]|nr:shikimate kinase [Fimbriimonadaceae bacterium]HRJ95826.1 shikimate kinase [Fimbriimonadaceae bacterium]
MMGAGKSTVGREVARLAGRPFFDTDQLLSYRLGRPIPQLFSIYGEAAFRYHETAILRGLEPQPGVLATGGGIVVREANWVEMKRLGTTVFLDVDRAALTGRLARSKKKRPLLAHENWEERFDQILAARRVLYEQADRRVLIGGESLEEAARKVLDSLEDAE